MLASSTSALPGIALLYPGSPAEQKGLTLHAVIVSIDGQKPDRAAPGALVAKLQGEAGTTVELELRLPVERVRLIMADTAAGPDDGGTAGSRTTPSTVPAIRKGCAAARQLLIAAAKTGKPRACRHDTTEVANIAGPNPGCACA